MDAHAGVSSVALEGNDKDKLVVIGEQVDSVSLVRALRKKFKHAIIETVEAVKDQKKEEEKLPPWGWYPPGPPTWV